MYIPTDCTLMHSPLLAIPFGGTGVTVLIVGTGITDGDGDGTTDGAIFTTHGDILTTRGDIIRAIGEVGMTAIGAIITTMTTVGTAAIITEAAAFTTRTAVRDTATVVRFTIPGVAAMCARRDIRSHLVAMAAQEE